MKQSHFIIFALLGFLMLGCQDQLVLRDEAPLVEIATKAGADEYSVQTNERYVFPSEKDYKAWTDIVSLEERLVSCEVPASTLRAMTTDALVRTVLNYPLNFIYSAYDNPLDAVDIIVKNSPLHQELFSRSDAVKVLLQHFDQTFIDRSGRKSMFNLDDTCLTFSHEIFFEYLLAYCLDTGQYSKRDKQALQKIAQRKLSERESNPDIYSALSTTPLQMIVGDIAIDSPVRTQSTWNWYSPFGSQVVVNQYDEMTSSERDQLTYDYMVAYPNATLHAMASNLYNGHGYAWIIRDPTVNYNDVPELYTKSWVNDVQVSYFLSDGFYETCSASDAEKVFYMASPSHSAVLYPGSTPLYISKWGNGPLMEHTLAYCPYSSSNLQYYKVRTTTLLDTQKISGPSHVYVDSINVYSFPPLRGLDSWTWEVESFNPQQSTAFAYYPIMDNTYCIFSCIWPGLYIMTVEGTYNNNTILRSEKNIFCP